MTIRSAAGLHMRSIETLMVLAVIALVLYSVNVGVSGQYPGDPPPPGSLQVDVGYWHDVDTPKDCLIHLPLGVILDEPQGLRADNYDGWEVGNRPGQVVTDEEKAKGKTALKALVDTFDEQDLRFVPSPENRSRDKYGRPLGRFWLRQTSTKQWVELGSWAIDNKFVRTSGG